MRAAVRAVRWVVPVLVGLVLASAAVPAGASTTAVAPPPASVVTVGADAETVPTLNPGDSADDPALWVDPVDPARSLLIGNDKRGALEVYDLAGNRVQRITTSTRGWGNVDVRQQVRAGGFVGDLVAALNGTKVLTYRVDTDRHALVGTSPRTPVRTAGGQGLCLYAPRPDEVYVITITKTGGLQQRRLTDPDGDGLLTGTLVREVQIGGKAEGCVTDDVRGDLYVSEEDRGIWRYGAAPSSGSARTLVDDVSGSGHLSADVEGLTIARFPGGDVLIASAQNVKQANRSYFAVYDLPRATFSHAFRIVDGSRADGCSRTDGITAHAGSLGPGFPSGVFVCQDNDNTAPGDRGNQDFKLTRLERVLDTP